MTSSHRRSAMRRVAVVTGSRAEYGLLRGIMEAVRAHRRLELQVVVTGMHLLRRFGYTAREITRDGWHVDARVKMQLGDDASLDQATGLARGVSGVARFLERAGTDIVLVLGDRIEAMAGALAGVTTGRLVAHVHGGDLAAGDFDDSFRHAVSKLAHLHFPATPEAGRRLIRMGEHRGRVHVVGAPGLDRIRELIKLETRGRRAENEALIVQHATGRSVAIERRTMTMILKAAQKAGLRRTVIYPNTDRGNRGIIEAIQDHERQCQNGAMRAFRSLDRDNYLRLLIDADVLMGNSSSGIIEAGAAGTPAVNIGHRQQGRLANGRAVIHAEESFSAICTALKQALQQRPGRSNARSYRTRGTGPRIAALLAEVPLDLQYRRKVNAY